MTMTPAEIAKSYREAKNRKSQIGVLADLNACKKADILAALVEAGEITPEDAVQLQPKKPGRPPRPAPAPAADPPREGYTRLIVEPPAPETPSGCCKNCNDHSPEPEELDHALAEAVEAIAGQVKRLRAERDKRLAEARTAEQRIRDMYRLIREVFEEGAEK